jgi:hypothetical protein
MVWNKQKVKSNEEFTELRRTGIRGLPPDLWSRSRFHVDVSCVGIDRYAGESDRTSPKEDQA